MNNICILVPTFPPHFQYAYRLIKSYFLYDFDKQADLYFVFTNQLERESFIDWENVLVLPKSLHSFEKRGIINIKKYYGLLRLKKRYSYILTMDDETYFIKSVDLDLVCNKFFRKKVLYGNETFEAGRSLINNVLNHCQAHFK